MMCPPGPGASACSPPATSTLAQQITKGEGQLSVTVDDSGVLETVSKTLPVLMRSVDASVYPEGGDLIAGLPNRVYVEVLTPWGNPADVHGDIRAVGSSATVATVSTVHEGRGVSNTFVPRADTQYEIVVTSPAGVAPIPMPDVRRIGATVTPGNGGVSTAGEPVTVTVSSAPGTSVRVALFRHQRELAASVARIPAHATDPSVAVTLTPPSTREAEGVLRVTLFDTDSGHAIAER